MKHRDLCLVRFDTQTVSVSSPSTSSIVLFTWNKVCMVLGCDAHTMLSCVSGFRVCTCTSLMTSGGRRGAITDILITSLVYSVFFSRQVNKTCSSYHAFLVDIFNMLDSIQQLTCE